MVVYYLMKIRERNCSLLPIPIINSWDERILVEPSDIFLIQCSSDEPLSRVNQELRSYDFSKILVPRTLFYCMIKLVHAPQLSCFTTEELAETSPRLENIINSIHLNNETRIKIKQIDKQDIEENISNPRLQLSR